MSYEVQTPVFEGPFDLLLHLILKQEVDLWEVSLSAIVDSFVAEVEKIGSIDLDLATEFLLIAATLVELKSRRLLPGPSSIDLDEELLRFEERDLLLARLLECKTFKDAARTLGDRMAVAGRSFPRLAGPEEPFRSMAPDPLESITPAALAEAALRGLTPEPVQVVRTDHVAPVRASVRDAIESVLALLPATGCMPFRSLIAGVAERMEIVVRFLACLELFKQGVIDLEQVETFGDLVIRPLQDDERASLDMSFALDEWDEDAEPVRLSHPAGAAAAIDLDSDEAAVDLGESLVDALTDHDWVVEHS